MSNYVILPLFSEQGGIHVPERSGLNQWNADGRLRASDEAYIRIPSWIHRVFRGFFPSRDTSFVLTLPNGTNISAKVCQDNSKALMSNPNVALGEWILRIVLNQSYGKLATYQTLINAKIDSVKIVKINESNYSISCCPLGTYNEFKRLNKW
jgi:hypothetical protein